MTKQMSRPIETDILARLAVVMLIPLGLLAGSCNTSGCTDNHSALPLMGLYDYATGQSVALDSIDFGGIGAPGDSLLVHSGEKCSQVYLPFRDNTNTTSFLIHYDYKLQGLDDPAFDDIITFHYDVEPYFASSECGAMYRYVIRGVDYTRHLVDSVAVVDSVITNVEMERIKVFFRMAASGPEEENPGEDTPAEEDTPSEDIREGGDA